MKMQLQTKFTTIYRGSEQFWTLNAISGRANELISIRALTVYTAFTFKQQDWYKETLL